MVVTFLFFFAFVVVAVAVAVAVVAIAVAAVCVNHLFLGRILTAISWARYPSRLWIPFEIKEDWLFSTEIIPKA